MLNPDTLVVIGAGASKEAGLPLGYDLKKRIAEICTVHPGVNWSPMPAAPQFYNSLQESEKFRSRPRELAAALRKISSGVMFVASIDGFLEIHSTDDDVKCCAKYAIAWIILEQERSSKLALVERKGGAPKFRESIEDVWYLELAHMMFEKVEHGNVGEAFRAVRFIVFNYDRCLEWFLLNAVMSLYALTEQQAVDALSNCRIIHAYGDVGILPPLAKDGGPVAFGAEPEIYIHQAANRIQTYSEQAAKDTVTEIQSIVAESRAILFLGLSFHPQNLDIMIPAESAVRHIYGTRQGLSESAHAAVQATLTKKFKTKGRRSLSVELANSSCCDFLRSERRALVVS